MIEIIRMLLAWICLFLFLVPTWAWTTTSTFPKSATTRDAPRNFYPQWRQPSRLIVKSSPPVQGNFATDTVFEDENLLWSIDPLISSVLLASTDNDGGKVTDLIGSGNIAQASSGINVWRNALLKGRLPLEEDFSQSIWPAEPLFSAIVDALQELELPRFVLRHPEANTSVLLTMIRMAMEFNKQLAMDSEDEEENVDDEEDEDKDDIYDSYYLSDDSWSDDSVNQSQPSEGDLAAEIASGFIDQFGGVIQGTRALDQIFGAGHGLLDAKKQDSGGDGFGLQDGIWEHTGWQDLPALQRELASMTELREMMKILGRRPTAEGSDIRRFAPRDLDRSGGLGAQFDPLTRSSVNGLTLSNSLAEMLPSEAVLLKGSPALRRLFMAKRVESKLLSYELSGWTDVPSIPRLRPRYNSRLPSAPGGPIIVCLDTSWSMSGRRESLSKAVVLACVSAAHKQRRECQVVAFSNERGVMDCGQIVADANGVERLLEFLSNSFGGGTDVTGALKYAMANIGTDAMSAADLLLVTDGEIPDPPVSGDVLEDLDHLKRRTGMEIHGLLVGKGESKPLSKLCTQTHDFLIGYDTPFGVAPPTTASSRSLLSSKLFARASRQGGLHNTYGWSSRQGSSMSIRRNMFSLYAKAGKMSKRKSSKSYVDEEEEDYFSEESEDSRGQHGSFGLGQERDLQTNGLDYNDRVDEAIVRIRDAVATTIKERAWQVSILDSEKNSSTSCWRYRDQLHAATERISENLIEREEESRLVVLGMVSSEHVLLLGPPGTGKSELGRRLSQLCGGLFFQRLLTRFTTPEEIFGPLSLRALENDEYKRCTQGFLPVASVAFLDEIFKANSAILNTLLTVLNERQFDNGAGVRDECPIRCVVGASNELPESDELDALYDRFLLRKEVLPVSDAGLMQILGMSNPGASSSDGSLDSDSSHADSVVLFTDGLDNVINSLSVAVESVQMGDDACALMRDLRSYMRDELDVDVSDRRLVKAARLLKFSAASHGRTRVDPIDCLLLQHMAWRLPEQRNAIRDWLWDHLTPGGAPPEAMSQSVAAQSRLLLDGLRREAMVVVQKATGDVTGASGARATDIEVTRRLRVEVSRIALLLQQRADLLARHMELLRRSRFHLWLDPDEAQAAQTLLLPKAEKTLRDVIRALSDAHALELALGADSGVSPEDNTRLSVVELLWDDDDFESEISFTDCELNIGMREGKAKYDLDTFRAWKRARKKAGIK